MARVTTATLEGLTKTVAKLYGYPAAGTRAPAGSKNTYKENFLAVINEGGFYRLMVVLKDSGVAYFGTGRGFKAAEMEVYLLGLIDGKSHSKARFR